MQGSNAVGHSSCTVICQSSYLQHFLQRDRCRARHDWMMSPLLSGNANTMFVSVPLGGFGRSFTGVPLQFADSTGWVKLQSQSCRRETYCRDMSRAAEHANSGPGDQYMHSCTAARGGEHRNWQGCNHGVPIT